MDRFTPLKGRAGTAGEPGEMIAFLVSDSASYITGHNRFISGGFGELLPQLRIQKEYHG
jgi:NAD(P)-dependent dehydrogenase (short-subunit alcohol dehydrogenase family)